MGDAKSIADMAEAARIYAKRAQLGQEAVNHATEIKLRAERKAGQVLQFTKKNEGTRGNIAEVTGGSAGVPPVDRARPTLAEIGVTKKESSRFQKLADLPAETFEEVAHGQTPLKEALGRRGIAAPAGILGR